MNRTFTAAIAGCVSLAAALTLAGCSPEPAPADPTDSVEASPIDLSISYVPYVGPRATFLGIDQGIFEDAGITITMNPVASPAPGVAAIVNGEAQFAFVTMVNLINAVAQGSALKCVTPLDGPTSADTDLAAVQLIAIDDDIQDPGDLEGKIVAQVSIGSANDLYTKELAKQEGVADTDFQTVQLGFAQMPAALQGGSIDAMVASEPFASQAVELGGHIIAYPEAELAAGWNATCWAASDAYISSNADDVQRFKTANEAAIAYAAEHPDEARAIIPTFLDIPASLAETIPLGTEYGPDINTDGIEDLIELMIAHSLITEDQAPSIDELVLQD